MHGVRFSLLALPLTLALTLSLTCDFHHEHASTQHVPRVVAPELDALVLQVLVVVEQLDLLHRLEHVLLVEELVVVPVEPGGVVHQYLVDRLGRVRHEDAASEAGLLGEVGHGAAVVQRGWFASRRRKTIIASSHIPVGWAEGASCPTKDIAVPSIHGTYP